MVQFGAKVFQTKLSRLSHKACRLLSSPVLLRKLATIITRRNKKRKSAVEDTWKQKRHLNKVFPTTTITRFLVRQCSHIANNLSKSYSTQQQSCSVRFSTANDEQCGSHTRSHVMVFDKTANYSLPRSRFGLVTKRSSLGRSVAWRDKTGCEGDYAKYGCSHWLFWDWTRDWFDVVSDCTTGMFWRTLLLSLRFSDEKPPCGCYKSLFIQLPIKLIKAPCIIR